ncbi:MAG: hypothetical protein IJ774_09485 [Selenomonadaceae bacterium]|nr:hypothetical protein [Selenomonadaceae bacterium]
MENFIQLNSDEKRIIESVYGRQFFDGSGYNPNKIEAIRDLSAQEKKFFAGKNFVSPHFYVQTLYKVRGSVMPIKFNAAIHRTLTDNENLRVNFCTVGTRTVKVSRSQNVFRPVVVFRNMMNTDKDERNETLSQLMEADMRREFDLKHDLLIRFSVFKTSEIDFAVLVTRAQLISDSFDAEKFFATVTDSLADVKPKTPVDDTWTKVFDRDAVRDYWSKVLDDAPPIAKLPFERNANGAYRQRSFRAKVPVDILSDLRGRAQSNQLMLTAILQSAWGFMLQTVNKRRDCLFCQILSASKRDEKFSLNMIPVRLIGDDKLTVEKIVTNQFRQLVVSQPYSRVDWDDLQALAGGKLFDHFLSFRDFRADEFDYVGAQAESSGRIVSQNSWDAHGMKLGAYFRYSERNLTLTFLYDNKCFVAGGVEKICELFNLILQQMLVDWNAKLPVFVDNLKHRMEMLKSQKTSPENTQKTIRNFLSQLPILQGRFAGMIDLFDELSTIETFYEGDRISGDVLAQKFIFVVDGKLVRSVDTGDGWYNPLDVVRRNAFINPTSFLDEPKLSLSAEVLTDQAQLLMIPRNVLLDAFTENPEIARSLFQYALSQMEKYQMLWLQS